jgi:HSP20 family molecular chaperone IbpA
MISFNITDDDTGVDADSVEVKVNGKTVYKGDTESYDSQYGSCKRLGKKRDYTIVYQSYERRIQLPSATESNPVLLSS